MKKRLRRPAPVSPEVATRALNDLLSSNAPDSATVNLFLDRVGFANLSDPEAAVALSSSACSAIRDSIRLVPSVSAVVIDRLICCDPSPKYPRPSEAHVAYLWLAQCAARAIKHLPPGEAENTQILHSASEMPLRYAASSAINKALVVHPDCPPEILYRAAVSWPLEDAIFVLQHPAAPDEARVALALRQ